MGLECGECEHDLRGGHDENCSRHPSNVIVRLKEEVQTLRRHRDDLHEANNRYLERARVAEAALGAERSIGLREAIINLCRFIDMIEARAMAVDGPVTPFCEELHAAGAHEKDVFQQILGRLYQFRNCWVKKPLVTPEWAHEKAALEDVHDPTTGKPIDPNWPKAWKTMCEVFHNLGYPDIDRYEHTALVSDFAGRADSLNFVEMLIEIEKHSGFLIDENELPNFKVCTIGDVAHLLAAKMAKAGAA